MTVLPHIPGGSGAAGDGASADAGAEGAARRPELARVRDWADAHRWWLLAACAVLYIAGFAPHWYVSPDGGTCLIVARNIAEGTGFTHPIGLHAGLPPGFPHFLAAIMRVFGTEALWAINAAMLLIGCANLALAFWLVLLYAGRGTAVVVTLLLAMTETHFRYCLEPMADLPFAAGLLLLLVGIERIHQRRPFFLGSLALAGAGILVMGLLRSVVLTAVAGVAIGLGWELVRRRRFGTLAAIAVAAVGALLVVRAVDPNVEGIGAMNEDERILLRLVTEELPQTVVRATTDNLYLLLCETTSRAVLGADFGPWVNLPIGVIVLAAGLALARRRPVWGAIVAMFALQWLLFIVDRRYFVAILPLLVLGCWQLAAAVDARYARRLPGHVARAFLLAWVLLNGARVGRIIVHQHHPRFLDVHQNGVYSGLDAMSVEIEARTPPDAAIFTGVMLCEPVMLWTRRAADERPGPLLIEPTGPVYVVDPVMTPVDDAFAARGWTRGEPLVTIPRTGGHAPLVLREIVKAPAPASEARTE